MNITNMTLYMLIPLLYRPEVSRGLVRLEVVRRRKGVSAMLASMTTERYVRKIEVRD